MAKSELMNKKRRVRTPKFVIEESDSSTVERRILNELQDLMILNTLSSLNARSTDRPELSDWKNSSNKLMHTITPSKMLKPSSTYFLIPSPNSLRTISRAKITVKITFAMALANESHSG